MAFVLFLISICGLEWILARRSARLAGTQPPDAPLPDPSPEGTEGIWALAAALAAHSLADPSGADSFGPGGGPADTRKIDGTSAETVGHNRP